MRENKNTIILTAIIAVVCLFICIVLHDPYDNSNLLYDLSLACFGSALLGTVIDAIEYMAKRRDAMEQFSEEIEKVITVLGNIPVIEISGLVRGALSDEDGFLERKTENCDKLKDYIESRIPIDENTTEDQMKEWIENAYKSELDDARTQLKKGAEAYIAFADLSLFELSNAYGRLDFLFGNKTVRKHAYDKLYNKIRAFKSLCLDNRRILNPYLQGKGNEIVSMDKMVLLQSKAFENRDGAYYAKLRDDLRYDLETFRSQIYNIKPEYDDPYPIHYLINFEDPESYERYKRHLEKARSEGRDEETKI